MHSAVCIWIAIVLTQEIKGGKHCWIFEFYKVQISFFFFFYELKLCLSCCVPQTLLPSRETGMLNVIQVFWCRCTKVPQTQRFNRYRFIGFQFYRSEIPHRGAWVAQWVECPGPWFQLRSWSRGAWVQAPRWALCWWCRRCLGFSLSPSLSAPPLLACTLNKQTNKKK